MKFRRKAIYRGVQWFENFDEVKTALSEWTKETPLRISSVALDISPDNITPSVARISYEYSSYGFGRTVAELSMFHGSWLLCKEETGRLYPMSEGLLLDFYEEIIVED